MKILIKSHRTNPRPADMNNHTNRLLEEYGEKAVKPCKRCKQMSHPDIHSGCVDYKHKDCNWYTDKG